MNIFVFYSNKENKLYHISTNNIERIVEEKLEWVRSVNCHTHSSSEGCNNHNYGDLETILSKKEFNMLCNVALLTKESVQSIINKLISVENIELLNSIIDREKEILMEEYNLTEEEYGNIAQVLDDYYLDRNCICQVFDGYEEIAEQYISENTNISNCLHKYIDFKKMGDDIVHEDGTKYVVLTDDRVVMLYR